MAKVGPRSFLIGKESGNLYRRNRKFIRQDPRQEQASLDINGTNPSSQPSPSAGSPAKSLPDAMADPPLNQAPTMRRIRGSPQPKSTAVEAIVDQNLHSTG